MLELADPDLDLNLDLVPGVYCIHMLELADLDLDLNLDLVPGDYCIHRFEADIQA